MPSKENLFDYKSYQQKSGRIPNQFIECPVLMYDIVGFSGKMNNKDMMNIIDDLQDSMIKELNYNKEEYYWAEKGEDSAKNNLLFVSTGDGYAIAIGNLLKDREVLKIAARVYKAFKRKDLKFRMGIAKGRNVLSIDMNDNLNIFGFGMVLATRICDQADNGQILVEKNFGLSLQQDENIPELQLIEKEFVARHEFKFNCYNYYGHSNVGINSFINSQNESIDERDKFTAIISNFNSKKLIPNKKYWNPTDIFTDDSDFIFPAKTDVKRLKATLWSDMTSEYDARFLYEYIKSLNIKHNPDFDNVFQLWLIDENNHFLGFKKLYTLIDSLTSEQEIELEENKSNFDNFKHIFKDEFSILLVLAYDELATVQLYTEDIDTYQSLGKHASIFINKVISDEGWHYGKFFSMLKEFHLKFLLDTERVKSILNQIIKLDGKMYQRTFILDHSRELYTPEISKKVQEKFMQRIEKLKNL